MVEVAILTVPEVARGLAGCAANMSWNRLPNLGEASIAWLLFNGKRDLATHTVFELAVTPQLVLLGFLWAPALGLLGAMLPAIRAGRLRVADAIRAASIR
jgi:ABC-type lipoprotein release transport system permease subunit